MTPTKNSLLVFNTGRPYSEHGQRVAAQAIDGGVLMHDADRHLTYFFAGCALSRPAIMQAYDSAAPRDYYPPSAQANGFAAWPQMRADLEAAANSI